MKRNDYIFSTLIFSIAGLGIFLARNPAPSWGAWGAWATVLIILLNAYALGRRARIGGPLRLPWAVAVLPLILGAVVVWLSVDPGSGNRGSGIIQGALIAIIFLGAHSVLGAAIRIEAIRKLATDRAPGDWTGRYIGTAIEPIKPGQPVSVIRKDDRHFVQVSRKEEIENEL